MTGRRIVRRAPSWRLLSRVDHPEVPALAIVLAAVAAAGWFASPFWLAVAVAGQLVLGGLGAVWIIGPGQARLGFARFATLAAAGVAVTLFGRTLAPVGGLFLLLPAAAVLWAVLWVEQQLGRGGSGRLGLELAMVGIAFASGAGLLALVPRGWWGAAVGLLLATLLVPALRMAEARGAFGARGVGQALLHLLAVSQVAVAVLLLGLPGVVAAALVALTFHAWAGAAEALEGQASGRAVALEFGSLVVLGLVVALLLHTG